MKRLILSTVFAAFTLPAMAADMPVKAPIRVGPAAVSTWTGFYLFGFGGYSRGKISPDDFDLGEIEGLHNPKPDGAVFGFGGGYNWQSGRWVGGLEIDYGFSNEKDDQSLCLTSDCSEYNIALGINSKIDSLGSARLRAGYLIMDNVLVYGTGGLGWGRSKVDVNITVRDETFNLLSGKKNEFGWVAGGGVEVALPIFNNWRIRGEYLHYDFGSTGYAFQTPFVVGVNINAKTTDDVIRGALVIPFGN